MSNRKLRLAGQLMLLLASAAGGAGMTYGAMTQGWFEEPPPEPIVLSEKPLFQSLDKIVIGLSGERTQRYMLLELALVSHDPHFEEQSSTLTPVIHNAILQYFSQHDAVRAQDEIQDIAALQDRLLEQVRTTVASYEYELAVDKVLLTKVVIQ